jgi:hypothetical protein
MVCAFDAAVALCDSEWAYTYVMNNVKSLGKGGARATFSHPEVVSGGTLGQQEISFAVLSESPLYSEKLGIDIEAATDDELFKWFLASLLFGARISSGIAERTYRSFERHNLLRPQAILDAGWDYLVDPIMKEGGYVRYDEKTSRKVLMNCDTLITEYGSSLNALHDRASDGADLEKRLLAFYGVGPTTVNIFLRELRPFWRKADPAPLPSVLGLASRYNLPIATIDRKSLTFARVEAGLIRIRREFRMVQ